MTRSRQRKNKWLQYYGFDCERCGHCCTHLKGTNMGQVHGLTLLPDEIRLFPKELVKPMFRYSLDHPLTPGKVFIYQLDVDVCPHYDREEGCLIHGRHPATCQAFPFELSFSKLIIHGKCPVTRRMEKQGVKMNRAPGVYLKAAMKVHAFYTGHLNPYVRERFDLKTGSWRGIAEGMTEDEIAFLKGGLRG